MQTDTQQLKKSFAKAVIWLLFLLVVASGTTFAWFTLSGISSTNVTPVSGTVSDGNGSLLISAARSGPFEKSCNLVLDANPDALQPVSTANLENFYQATAQNKEGISLLYKSVDSSLTDKLLHGTVYLKCEGGACDVYFNPEELNLGSDSQALAAMRLGMKITSHTGTKTWIWKLDDLGSTSGAQSVRTISAANSVVSSISQSGQPSYTTDPAENIGDYMAEKGSSDGAYQAGNKIVVQMNADEIATVEYWLYLEGCDDQCSNPVQNRNTEIKLAFAVWMYSRVRKEKSHVAQF